MTLLSICQDALDQVPQFATPSEIVGNADQTAKLLLALAKRELRELTKPANPWQVLRVTHTFTSDASETYDLPSDFGRIVDDTAWDRSEDEPMLGPVDPVTWNAWQSSDAVLVTRLAWRIIGDKFVLYPATDTGTDIAYEYVKNTPVLATDGTTYRTTFAADTDTCLIDEDVVSSGVLWRFLRSMGQPYDEEWNEYKGLLAAALAKDGGKPRIRLDPDVPSMLYPRVPEGNWS